MDAQQQSFTFDRSERFAALRAATWMPRNVAQLIEAIETSPNAPSVAYLVARLRRSERSVQAAIREAKRRGILAVMPRYSSRGCQLANEYRIDWQAIMLRNRTPHAAGKPPAREGAESAPYPAKTAPYPAVFAPYEGADSAPLFHIPKEINSSPPPTSLEKTGGCAVLEEGGEVLILTDEDFDDEADDDPTECDTMTARSAEPRTSNLQPRTPLFDPPSDPAGWIKARRRLVQCGVAAADAAIRNAQGSGWSPGGVLAACEHFLRHRGATRESDAWEPGALFNRLRYVAPEVPVDEGWPPKRPRFLAEQAEEARMERLRSARRTQSAASLRRERERETYERLNAECGPALDSMPAAEFAALVAEVPGADLLLAADHGKRTGRLLRELLLPIVRQRMEREKRTTHPRCDRTVQPLTNA